MSNKFKCPACGSNSISVRQKLTANARRGVECGTCRSVLFKRAVLMTSVFDGLLFLSFFFFFFLSFSRVSVWPMFGFVLTIAAFELIKLLWYPLTTTTTNELAHGLGRRFGRALRKRRSPNGPG